MLPLFVNTRSEIPYDSKGYKKKNIENNFVYKGVTYKQKIAYEKKLSLIFRIELGILAFLASLVLIPLCLNPKKVKGWWKRSVEGIDERVVLIIKNQKTSTKQVQFNKARGKYFLKWEPANKIGKTPSIELTDFKIFTEEFPQERGIPPVSLRDTSLIDKTGEIQSVHGTAELFSDSAIVEKLDIVKRVKIDSIYVQYTKYKKAIFQQLSTRGCTAATAAMFILDRGKIPDLQSMKSRNLGNDEDQIRDIKNGGLTPLTQFATTLIELKNLLEQCGPAIVTLQGKLGNHVVIVDEVNDSLQVRLRDPYHGWEITVTKEAFLEEWKTGKIIQLLENSTEIP